MKNRKRQRENRRKGHEELLSKRNSYGFKDLTAYNAVRGMREGSKAVIALQ